MTKFLMRAGFALLFSLPFFAHAQLTARDARGFKADGNLDEWNSLANTVKEDGYQYDLAQNDSSVFLGIKVYDALLRKKMLTTGLIATIKSDNSELSVSFPFPQNAPAPKKGDRNRQAGPPPASTPRPDARAKPGAPKPDTSFGGFVAAIREMKIEGLPGGTRTTDKPESIGITGRLAIDDDKNLVYELAIPKRFFAGKRTISRYDLALLFPAIKKNMPYTPYYPRMYNPYGMYGGGYGRGYGNPYYGSGYLPPMPMAPENNGPDASLYRKTSLKTTFTLP
ncbi:MAG: hypothetical protein INR69_17520 [Mucilaginibacter polytrichastri]|nr:hypothetical protein [Mucilaginibacter polytrichastri]